MNSRSDLFFFRFRAAAARAAASRADLRADAQGLDNWGEKSAPITRTFHRRSSFGAAMARLHCRTHDPIVQLTRWAFQGWYPVQSPSNWSQTPEDSQIWDKGGWHTPTHFGVAYSFDFVFIKAVDRAWGTVTGVRDLSRVSSRQTTARQSPRAAILATAALAA